MTTGPRGPEGDAAATGSAPRAWPRIGVMGGGAVGCLYGGWLARAGAPVVLVGRPRHVEAIRAQGLRMTGKAFADTVAIEASTDRAALSEVDLLLFCTKTRDTEDAARQLTPVLSPSATVLAFQNGVDGAERIGAILPNPVFPAALIVSCQMAGPGVVQHNGRGDVILGEWFEGRSDAGARATRLAGAVDTLSRAGIPATQAEDIRRTMWTKLAMNCAYNAISALGRARYRRLASAPHSVALMETVVRELIAVGRADGVALDFDDVFPRVMELGDSMAVAISSTGQDIAASRRTEIDDLNGFVVRRGQALGVPTPVNATLQTLVRILEEAPVDPAFFPEVRKG